MNRFLIAPLFALAPFAAVAEETRQLGAHEHGVGALNIAFQNGQIAIELEAPGADIVGFEYTAQSAEDRAKVDAAVADLARPLDLFVVPAAAGCSVVQASAALESEDAHEDHDDGHDHAAHKEEDHDAHDGDDHAEHDHDAHDEKEHAEHDHDVHHDKEHAEHDHDGHDEKEQTAQAEHTEFHAEYLLTCADTSAASPITFAYFERFPNARELEVQVISSNGASAFEVERDQPTLDLRDMF